MISFKSIDKYEKGENKLHFLNIYSKLLIVYNFNPRVNLDLYIHFYDGAREW